MRVGSFPSAPAAPSSTAHREHHRGSAAVSSSDDQEQPRQSRPLLRTVQAGEPSRADVPDAVEPRHRLALQTYLANQPRIYERLGVELAGVDLYV